MDAESWMPLAWMVARAFHWLIVVMIGGGVVGAVAVGVVELMRRRK